MRRSRYDIAIIGGGPSGAAAALALARGGMSVVLFERTAYDTERIGEVVPPAIAGVLHELGADDILLRGNHLKLSGVTSAWGAESPGETDYIFTPPGHGWILNRCQFDSELAKAAANAGAGVRPSSRVAECCREQSTGWTLKVECDDHVTQVGAGFVIRATGRTSAVRGLATGRISSDKLLAILHYPSAVCRPEAGGGRLHLESTPDGWWYGSSIPGGRTVIGCFTDSDLFAGAKSDRCQLWNARFGASRLVSREYQTSGEPKLTCVTASTSRARIASGPGWMAIGDAAVNIDPLAGQGVLLALRSGMEAASLLLRNHPAPGQHIFGYEQMVRMVYENAVKNAGNYYRIEKRWPESMFWQRRMQER